MLILSLRRGQILTGQASVGITVLVGGLLDDLGSEGGGRRLAVPVGDREQVVADELLVKRRLRAARLIGFGIPEPRRVRSQRLIDQQKLWASIRAGNGAELELGVRHNNAAACGIITGELVEGGGGIT